MKVLLFRDSHCLSEGEIDMIALNYVAFSPTDLVCLGNAYPFSLFGGDCKCQLISFTHFPNHFIAVI